MLLPNYTGIHTKYCCMTFAGFSIAEILLLYLKCEIHYSTGFPHHTKLLFFGIFKNHSRFILNSRENLKAV